MSINSASDAKMFNQLCSSGKADSSQVKTTTAPTTQASPITGGLTTQTSIKTTYTSAYTQDELAALQKKDQGFFSKIYSGAKSLFNSIFGAEYSIVYEQDYSQKFMAPGLPINVTYVEKENKVIEKMGDSSKPISVYCTSSSNGDITQNTAGLKINILGLTVNLGFGLKNTGITASYTNDNNTTYVGCSVSLSDLEVSCNAGNTYTEGGYSSTIGGSTSFNGPLLYGILYGFPQGMPYGPPPSYSPIPVT